MQQQFYGLSMKIIHAAYAIKHGRRLRGDWEDGPPKKFKVGRRPMHLSHQYFEK